MTHAERHDSRPHSRPDGRQRAASGSPYEATIGFSRAVRDGDHVYVAGTAPVRPDGEVDPDTAAQARRCWEIALAALRELGGDTADVVRTRQYLTPAADPAAVGAVHGEVFGDARPASTMVVVAALLDPRWVVEVEVDALLRPREP
jgi:enamine deaminase RidA (YjgF/YER057c/UK114 family)